MTIKGVLKTIGIFLLVILLLLVFIIGSMVVFAVNKSNDADKRNADIATWHRERDEIYLMEQCGFAGVVTDLSPGIHRGSTDTVTVKLASWQSSYPAFTGEDYLRKINDKQVLLFISYYASIFPPNEIEVGDSISKERFSFDFSIYNKQAKFKKKLSLLFCDYENPDTIITKKNLVFGTYETYFNAWDTLFAGNIRDGRREGSWRYYQAHTSRAKILEGQYAADRRNGLFYKYYDQSSQLAYEENYKDNLPDGRFVWWFSNGQPESQRFYVAGKPSGIWKQYDDKGNLRVWESYDDKGKLLKRERYEPKTSGR